MKKHKCIAALLLTLSSSIHYAWSASAATSRENKGVPEAPKKPPKGAKQKKEEIKDPLVTPMQIMTIPMIFEDHVEAYLTLKLEIKGTDLYHTAQIREKIILLHDAIFTDLYKALHITWGSGYTPSKESIQKRVSTMCQRVLGSNVIENVSPVLLSWRVLSGAKNSQKKGRFL